MEPDAIDADWMNEHCRVSLEELASISGLPGSMLVELVECGALLPEGPEPAQWHFSAHCVLTLRKAGRLRNDFDLDANSLALAYSLLERIRDLESELDTARAQIPRRFP